MYQVNINSINSENKFRSADQKCTTPNGTNYEDGDTCDTLGDLNCTQDGIEGICQFYK